MQPLRVIYSEPEEVTDVLLRLFDVPLASFMRPTASAWLEWATKDEYDAPSFPGTLLWGHAVRHERRGFVTEHGWTPDNTKNFATVISPDAKTAIAVETGDRFTGVTGFGKSPRTNSIKGKCVMQMLADNRARAQSDLFAGFAQDLPNRNPDAPFLWIHLIHQSRGDVYGEVSLPLVANKRGRIVGWRTRIILPKWRGGDSLTPSRISPLQPTVEPEVRIVRRTG